MRGAERTKGRKSRPLRSCHLLGEIPCVNQIQCPKRGENPQKWSLQKLHKSQHQENQMVLEQMLLKMLQVYSNLQDLIISSPDTVTKVFMVPFFAHTGKPHLCPLIHAAVTSRTPDWQTRAQRQLFKLYGLARHSSASEARGGQVWVSRTDPGRAVCASPRQNERGGLNGTQTHLMLTEQQ